MSDVTSKGKKAPTAHEIAQIARNMTSNILLDELRSEWKELSSQKTLTDESGSSTSAQPTSSSTSTPFTAVADPSDSSTGDVGPSADPVEGLGPTAVTIVNPQSTKASNTANAGVSTILPGSPSETTSLDVHGIKDGPATPDTLKESGGQPTGVLEDATGWPAWLCSAVDYFKGVSTSPEWVELVEKWVLFEAHLSFPSSVSTYDTVQSSRVYTTLGCQDRFHKQTRSCACVASWWPKVHYSSHHRQTLSI